MLASPSGRWHRICNPDGKPRREFESHRQLHYRSVTEWLKVPVLKTGEGEALP